MESEQDQEVKIINSSPKAEDLEPESPDGAAAEEGSGSGQDEDQVDAEGHMVVLPAAESDRPRPQAKKRQPTALA
jgi:hypothetical protein